MVTAAPAQGLSLAYKSSPFQRCSHFKREVQAPISGHSSPSLGSILLRLPLSSPEQRESALRFSLYIPLRTFCQYVMSFPTLVRRGCATASLMPFASTRGQCLRQRDANAFLSSPKPPSGIRVRHTPTCNHLFFVRAGGRCLLEAEREAAQTRTYSTANP